MLLKDKHELKHTVTYSNYALTHIEHTAKTMYSVYLHDICSQLFESPARTTPGSSDTHLKWHTHTPRNNSLMQTPRATQSRGDIRGVCRFELSQSLLSWKQWRTRKRKEFLFVFVFLTINPRPEEKVNLLFKVKELKWFDGQVLTEKTVGLELPETLNNWKIYRNVTTTSLWRYHITV